MHNPRRLHRYRCHRVTWALGVENRAKQILGYGQLDHEFVTFGSQLDQFDLAGYNNPHIRCILSLMIEHFGSLIVTQVSNSSELRLRGFVENLEKPMLADDVDRLRKLLHWVVDLSEANYNAERGSRRGNGPPPRMRHWRGAALARTSSAQRHLFYDIVWPKRVRK